MSGRAGRDGATPRGLAGPKAEKTVSLALQGGGAHGAFTWGVLDALLEDGRLAIEAITGASAGAMNAVVHGRGLDGGRRRRRPRPARDLLAAASASTEACRRRSAACSAISSTPGAGRSGRDVLARMVSPYSSNPLNINPAARRARRPDRLRARPGLHGRASCSSRRRTSGPARSPCSSGARAHRRPVMASACLPTVFQAVEIGGEPYWDGGYTGNPALFPLFYETPDGRHPARADQPGRAARDAAHGAPDPRPPERDHLQRQPAARAARGRVRVPPHRGGQAVDGGVQAGPHAPDRRQPACSTRTRRPPGSGPSGASSFAARRRARRPRRPGSGGTTRRSASAARSTWRPPSADGRPARHRPRLRPVDPQRRNRQTLERLMSASSSERVTGTA